MVRAQVAACFACIALATISSHAQAALQFYTDKATFQTAAPGLVTEDFEAGHIGPPNYYTVCTDPFYYGTDDDCWNVGDILTGITVGSSSATGTVIFGTLAGAPSVIAGAAQIADAVEIGFPGGTPAVGMDLFESVQEDFTISIFGANDVPLGNTTVPIAASGGFFGVTSTQTIKRIEVSSADGPFVDNVSFATPAASPRADMALTLSDVPGPVGTETYTLTVTNLGPDTATGTAVTVDIPPGVSYVSDDCGGSNASPPWTRNIATLALNGSVVCHIVTTVVNLGAVQANVVSNGSIDLNPTNNTATDHGPAADMAITLTGVQAPVGTMTYTMTVTNLGPADATSVVASVDIPPALSYVSDDCGGSNASPPWSRNIATLALNASVVCHIVTTVVNPQAVVQANVVSHGSYDSNPANDTATAYGPVADLSVSLTGVENPPGSMLLTVTVTNLGPDPASSIVASLLQRPSTLAYVSDDCGGSHSLSPWTWNIASLANGNNVVCHIHTTVATPQGLGIQASVVSNGPTDLDNSNDFSTIYTSVTGAGPSTPDSGIALFRSFYDLALKDETGAAFSLRSHADKIMLLQICAVWCPPCNAWTNLSPQLAQAVDQKIGVGHFLDVDMLTQGPVTSTPSTQTDAQTWKTKYSFPGPVVHAEGSYTSPLWEFDTDRFGQYAAIQSSSFFPEFFILAPDCNNQIAVRVSPGLAMSVGVLGEQRSVDLTSIDEMANLIADVWNQRPCAKPQVHRIDRCSVGAAPLYSKLGSTDSEEAAVPITVAGGDEYDIGSLTAVTDAPVLDFNVYADASGAPGSNVCSSLSRPTTPVFSPNVRKISLNNACKLGPGKYWMSLQGRDNADSTFVPSWFGGFLPQQGPFMWRDPNHTSAYNCATWGPANTCIPAQATTQPCFMIEDFLFKDGFQGP